MGAVMLTKILGKVALAVALTVADSSRTARCTR
jgi:hypothetical protein